MPSSAHKKVILRRSRGEILPGYLPLSGFVRQPDQSGKAPEPRAPAVGAIDLLDLSGRVVTLPLTDVKLISYVRDFNLSDTTNPERLTRRDFLARPRTEGLWLRLTFTSGEQLEGLAPTDLTLLDDLVNDTGLFLIPPDTRSNTQRIFVPRTSISELTLLAVITSPTKKKAAAIEKEEAEKAQQDLFHTDLSTTRPN